MSEHELWNELGNLYFMSGAYNQAAHAYERSIQTKASFGRPYSNLALTYVQQGKYDEAIDLYRRSIELLADVKEKAISWNRLGSVYRHLKDYSKAVIAFQEADELDPLSADDFPPDNPAHHQASPAPSSVLDKPVAEVVEAPEVPSLDVVVAVPIEEPELQSFDVVVAAPVKEPDVQSLDIVVAVPVEEPDVQSFDVVVAAVPEPPIAQGINEPVTESKEPEPALEWWDVDDQRVQAATQSPAAIAVAAEDPTTSWTPADLSQFQQDLSQMPQTGSLTTWGDPDFDDDFELWSPFDPTPDIEAPDPDSEDISTWLPLPEEEPLNLDELRVPPFVDEMEEEPEALFVGEPEVEPEASFAAEPEAEPESPFEWNDPEVYHTISNEQFAPVVSLTSNVATGIEMVQGAEIAQNRQKAWEIKEVDVDVQERPTTEFTVTSQELAGSTETETVACAAGPELVQPPSMEVPPLPEVQVPDRDEEEMREIEMGIAKFRRVVQLNPRNAHAWDALGTLFKSAGLYKDAILAYQQAISNDSSKSLYYHHLGLVYACEGRDEDAIGAFQRVIEIDPEYSLAHATLGGYYRKLGLEELAQKHIGKAMKNIFDSENEYNRACLEAICGNATQAIELLNVALKNKQTYVDWILRDPDLDFIRQDPRFKQLISEYTR